MVGRYCGSVSIEHSCEDSETAGTAGRAALNASPDWCRDETPFRRKDFKMFHPGHSNSATSYQENFSKHFVLIWQIWNGKSHCYILLKMCLFFRNNLRKRRASEMQRKQMTKWMALWILLEKRIKPMAVLSLRMGIHLPQDCFLFTAAISLTAPYPAEKQQNIFLVRPTLF